MHRVFAASKRKLNFFPSLKLQGLPSGEAHLSSFSLSCLRSTAVCPRPRLARDKKRVAGNVQLSMSHTTREQKRLQICWVQECMVAGK